MGFIPFAPEDGFPGVPGFLQGRLTGAIRFACIRYCLWFGKIPLPEAFSHNAAEKVQEPLRPCFAAVISSTRNPVSAKQKLSPPPPLGSILSCLALGFALLFAPALARADSLEDAARALARKVAYLLNSREGVNVRVRNLSSLSSDQMTSLSQTFERELQSRGHKVSHDDSSPVAVQLTFSENLSGAIEIAELVENGRSRFSFERVTLRAVPPGDPGSQKFTLMQELVWRQESPILDLKFLRPPEQNQQRIAVLSQKELSIYERQETTWALLKSLPIPPSGPQSRTPRGQLFQFSENGNPRLIASFPKLFCSINPVAPLDSPRIECSSDEQKELVGVSLLSAGPYLIDNGAKWDASGTYFTGEIYAESGIRLHIKPFFSAGFLALKSDEPSGLFIAAGIDGRARLLAHSDKELESLVGWGNEITTIHSTCDDVWHILASARKDWTEGDQITAYQVEEQHIVALDRPVALPGPVLSLGSEQIPSDAEFAGTHDGAIATVRNLKTGEYEAYRISLACNH